MNRTQSRIEEICQRSNGVHPLRQVSAIPDGYQKNRSQIWRLPVNRAYRMDGLGLINFDHRPGIGTYGSGSIRTKSFVTATETGRSFVLLCKEAARRSNLSWHEEPYGDHHDSTYLTWQAEWLERRESFRRAMLTLVDEGFLSHG